MLELDINTDAVRKEPIPGPSLPGILAELCQLAVEIDREGDIP
jgi:hypothetical protein